MKKLFIIIILIFNNAVIYGQAIIPYGLSLDSVQIFYGYYHSGPKYQTFHCYKPASYDSVTSPILFAMHGAGGNGTSAINDLDSIAERRKALIIAPNFPFSGFNTVMREQSADFVLSDTACCQSPTVFACTIIRPATIVINTIYKHVLLRESRQQISSYMIGFSAGGQFVNRYMLWRQLYPDSIPLKMAVSSNAYFYTFPTDTFLGVAMYWNCGLIPPPIPIPPYCLNADELFSFCNDHIIQYYNENYGVLIGTGDTQFLNDGGCNQAQGNNRYERALNFYNFADSNAINRGTTLQWPYNEIPGVGHDQHAMYNNKVNPNDTSTIAETLLFDTPYHTVPSIAAVAGFYADTTIIQVNGQVNFINTSYNAANYFWDFGDGSTSTLANPSHVYTTVDTFRVQLKAFDSSGCWNWTENRNYIKVIPPLAIETNESIVRISFYPNPINDKLNVTINNNTLSEIILYDITSRKLLQQKFTNSVSLNTQQLAKGIYLYEVRNKSGVIKQGKVVKE